MSDTLHESGSEKIRVVLYSSNARTRDEVRFALGRRAHPDLPEFDYLEIATAAVVIDTLDAGGVDLVVLDGEASPVGGMGLAKQLKDEIEPCPPVLVLVARRDDAWLAKWSRAEAVVSHPIDPIELAQSVTALLRTRVRA